MIKAEDVKELYESACGYELYCDIGEIERVIRKNNEIEYPVCGIFRLQPAQVTAIRSPFIGVASADIEIIAPTHMLEEVRTRLNTVVVAKLNGITKNLCDEHDADKKYSVSFTVQTCTAGERIDIGAWEGECIVLRQTLSFVIIEEGVSAYDTVLKIDGMEVPILTLGETKVHTTSVYPSANAIGHTASEQEAYGIDLTTPYVKSDVCEMFHNAVNSREGNRAHCVEITKNGVTNAYIMAISAAADSVQPPSNIGFNISLTEISASVGRFDGRWTRYPYTGDTLTAEAVWGKVIAVGPYESFPKIIFWGDGTSDTVTIKLCSNEYGDTWYEMSPTPYHVYTDGIASHDIMCFSSYTGDSAWREVRTGDLLFGKRIELVFKSAIEKEYPEAIPTAKLFEAPNTYYDAAVILGYAEKNEINYSSSAVDALVYDIGTGRVFFRSTRGNIYADRQIGADYCLMNGASFICPIKARISIKNLSSYFSYRVRLSELDEEVIM